MSKNKKYIIIGVALVLILAILYFIKSGGDATGDTILDEDRIDTTQVLKPVNPAGTYLLYNLLKKFEKTVSITTMQTTQNVELRDLMPLDNPNDKPNLYVSISEYLFLYSNDREYLLEFVSKGNYALVSSNDFSASFASDLFVENYITTYDDYYGTHVDINFTHPKFKQSKPLQLYTEVLNYHGKPKYGYFNYFNEEVITDGVAVISKNAITNFANCVMIPYGDGFFIVHTQPSNFSNINIGKTDGRVNAENIFSHFPANNIYWHQNFGKYSEYRGMPRPNKQSAPPQQLSRSSPLQFIISEPALLIALILLLVGLVFYMVVFSKRQQKIIPAIQPNKNASLEFVGVVSKLYFQQKQHNKLVNHMINIYIAFLREHYYINIAKKNQETIKLISEKSGIEENKIEHILETFKKAKGKQFTEKELVDLHVQLEYFYQHCN